MIEIRRHIGGYNLKNPPLSHMVLKGILNFRLPEDIGHGDENQNSASDRPRDTRDVFMDITKFEKPFLWVVQENVHMTFIHIFV